MRGEDTGNVLVDIFFVDMVCIAYYIVLHTLPNKIGEIIMKFEAQLLKGVAPVVVLEILSRGSMYGYELSQAIEKRSNEILTLGKGTLYPLLYNLEAKKLVAGQWEDAPSGRRRRYYSITSKGKAQLAAQKEQLESLHAGLKLVFGSGLMPA